MRFASITATGRYVPERVVTNAKLEGRLGEPLDEWLVARSWSTAPRDAPRAEPSLHPRLPALPTMHPPGRSR
jgi:3-oxoacyl-[acyl-carrier-protein] synthase III